MILLVKTQLVKVRSVTESLDSTDPVSINLAKNPAIFPFNLFYCRIKNLIKNLQILLICTWEFCV